MSPVARSFARLAYGLRDGDASAAVVARDAGHRRLLVLSDILAAALALLVGVVVAGEADTLTLPAFGLLPFVVLASWLMGLYSRDEAVLSKTTLNEVPALFHLATLYALLLYVGQGVLVDGRLGPAQGLGLWLAFFAATAGCRAVTRRLGVTHAGAERCLVIGDDDEITRACGKLDVAPALNAEVVAAMPSARLAPTTEDSQSVADLVRRHAVERVIVASPSVDTDELMTIVRDLKTMGVKVSVRPRILEVLGSAIEFEDLHGDVYLAVRRFGLSAAERRVKRALDVVLAALLLLALLPLVAVAAAAIKLEDRGPVFFRQPRIGRGGQRFWIWKFRTMVPDADAAKAALRAEGGGQGLFKLRDDPRVTRVGRLLRQTSLDELPQLLNVLRGEMSLVGPRPLVADEDEQIAGWHRRRLDLSPGMTGMWQIQGARLPLNDMVALDYLYIVNWSVWRDVQILLRTVGFVAGRRGM